MALKLHPPYYHSLVVALYCSLLLCASQLTHGVHCYGGREWYREKHACTSPAALVLLACGHLGFALSLVHASSFLPNQLRIPLSPYLPSLRISSPLLYILKHMI